MKRIAIQGRHFIDDEGRALMLRGVNLGGSSKVPARPDGSTHFKEGFYDHRNVSFVGRPFPIEEADVHFKRLRDWGLYFVRFLITWEALEHAGPGIYDEEYLEYVRSIIKKAESHGITVFIDPHQDVWSRFAGGDGAPGWTLEAAGFEIGNFFETGAAITHQEHGDPFPNLMWPTNGSKLAATTMFTLFFGGNDFAPKTKIDGEPVQEFLQRHYINAISKVASSLKGLSNVAGYGSMNEPLPGFIGWKNLDAEGGTLTLGESPTPFQAMLLGEGHPQKVAVWKMGLLGLKRYGYRILNESGIRAWQGSRVCVWKVNGVWDLDSNGAPILLNPDHFISVNKREVDFSRDYLRPFINRFAEEIRKADPDAMIFIEAEAARRPPRWGHDDAPNIVYAPHWYDAYVMAKKNYTKFLAADFFTHRPVIGPRSIRKSFATQLGRLKRDSETELGCAPVLLGEFGMPFDIRGGESFSTGDYSIQERALHRDFQAIESNMLSSTIWNYTSDNNSSLGDSWNCEDFSIFSADIYRPDSGRYSGGRALRAVIRPYPLATAGTPVKLSFDMDKRIFEYTFSNGSETRAPTVIFVPEIHYPHGIVVALSDGRYEYHPDKQELSYWHTPDRSEHTVRIGTGRG